MLGHENSAACTPRLLRLDCLGMPTKLAKGRLDSLLLDLLRDGPRHGYTVISELRERAEGTFDLPEGTVYPALHRLQDGGLLTSEWADVGGRRRRVYQLTLTGRAALAAGRKRRRSFASALDMVLRARPVLGAHVTGISL